MSSLSHPTQHEYATQSSDHSSVEGEDELFTTQRTNEAPEDHSWTSESDDDIPLASLRIKLAAPSKHQRHNDSNIPYPFRSALSLFEPLKYHPTPCQRHGKPNLNFLRNTNRHNPLGMFKLFVPTNVLREIAINTNKYAVSKGAGNGRPWHDTNARELQQFFGIYIYMGVYRSPCVEDYWDKTRTGTSHSMTKTMPLLRFQQLKRFFHVCDPAGDNGHSFFLTKCNPSWTLSSIRPNWLPSSKLSADEMIVMNYGRSSETVRMKNKPIGSGFKISAIFDSGFLFFAFPHSNRDPWKFCRHYKGKLPHSAAIVKRLTEELPRNLPGFRESVMYVIFMDNLLSTPKLFKLLREEDIADVETVRSNASGFPKPLAIHGKDFKLSWNDIGAVVCQGCSFLALTWIENGAVQILTTLHPVGPGHTVERRRKRPRLTSTNGRRVREVFGNSSTKVLPIPKVVEDCNFNMGGVDIADKLRSVYTCHMPSRRTWILLFLDIGYGSDKQPHCYV